MNKILGYILIALCCNTITAQHSPSVVDSIRLRDFLKFTNQSLEDIPKETMIFKDRDTLILFRFADNPNKDLITVPFDYRSKKFTDIYEKVAFKDPNVRDTFPASMKYWKDEMRIYFSKEVHRKDRKGLTDFALNIASKVDSLKMDIVNNVEDSNFVVYYKGSYEYEPRMSSSAVDFYLSWKGAFIEKGALRIDPEVYFNQEMRLKQLKRYFVKTLGYFEDTRELDCNSYFSSCVDAPEELSQLDLELIQYHYSYGFCKGATLKMYQEQLDAAEIFRDKPDSYRVAHPKSIFKRT
ncbi:hypothetical protein AAU57_07495 [Nonlabens sp. YIK11]|uniref:hypothetical protein n=1 Tax=Nonlabens sp. YIK11 TaxID=1453349 RepID=UPI0006DC7436|nr:hypothetical protein [Nonlabens sp. YIK11]KQC33172.1 hypothetical protein AAU57_07495 [Nonlabens sp. YIK11]